MDWTQICDQSIIIFRRVACQIALNSEFFVIILLSRKALNDIIAMLKIRN